MAGRGPRGQRVSLLVRNLPMDARGDEVRKMFERYGEIRDVYLPKDYYTGKPKGFGFIEFYDNRDAEDALYALDRTTYGNREISVVMSKESRKTPRDMIKREDTYSGRDRGRNDYRGDYRGGGGGGRDRSRDRDYRRRDSRSRSRSRDRDRSRERDRSRSRSRGRDRSRDKSRDRSRDRSRDKSRDRSRERSRSNSRDRKPADSPVRNRSSSPRGDRKDDDVDDYKAKEEEYQE